MKRKKPIDLAAVREARANLKRIAKDHPELVTTPSEVNRRAWEDILEEAMSPSVQVGVRLSEEQAARVDAFTASIERATPGLKLSRSDALRALISRALDAWEAEQPKKRR